jgi:SAM-dependent methyltransferase
MKKSAQACQTTLTFAQALHDIFPRATFRGLDVDAAQVQRYNAAAGGSARMGAVQGDLVEGSEVLGGLEWRDFDVAVTSMALHHIRDPVGLLVRLAGRVRSGGSVVVVDFICPVKDGRDSSLVAMPEGERWLGFSSGQARRYMEEAGCEKVELLEFPYDAGEGAPKEMQGLQCIFIAKGRVV